MKTTAAICLALLLAPGIPGQSEDDLRLWIALRNHILADSSYFDSQVRHTALPLIEGTIVTMDPLQRPDTLFVGIETPLVAELQLKILRDGEPARMRTTPARKSKIRFRAAVPEDYRKQPFALIASIDEEHIDYVEAGAW